MDQSGKAIHVLAVEDRAAISMTLDLLLQATSYAVDLAKCEAEAIEAVRLRSYDLARLDLDLRDMDGCTTNSILRRVAKRAGRFPVVALTARKAEAERFRAADLDGYITKSFQPLKLLDEIRRWTNGWPSHSRAAVDPLIWDRPRYREIADRLGTSHTEMALEMFESHLVASLAAIRASPADVKLLARQAHAFVSSAGMLGFSELSRVSRRIALRDHDCLHADNVKAVETAGELTLTWLRNAPYSTLA